MIPELVVFDLAGTTVKDNRDVHRILQRTLQYYDVAITLDDANEVMGIPKPVAIHRLLEKNLVNRGKITRDWIDEIHKRFITHMTGFYLHDAGVVEKEGVSEVFSALKERNVKVFVDTGFDRVITNALLDRMQWKENQLIDGSVTSDEVQFGRPYPDLIYKAMELSGTPDVRDVAKVGDTTADLVQGLNAGCRFVIGITSGAHSEDELKKVYHTHLVSNIEDAKRIILGD